MPARGGRRWGDPRDGSRIPLGGRSIDAALPLLLSGLLAFHVLMPYWSDQSPYVWIVRGCAIAGACIVAVEKLRTRSGSGAESKLALSVVLVLGLAVHVATVALVPLRGITAWPEGRRRGNPARPEPVLDPSLRGRLSLPPAVGRSVGGRGHCRGCPVADRRRELRCLRVVRSRGAPRRRADPVDAVECDLALDDIGAVRHRAGLRPTCRRRLTAAILRRFSRRGAVWRWRAPIGIGVGVEQLGLGLIPFLPVCSPGAPIAAVVAAIGPRRRGHSRPAGSSGRSPEAPSCSRRRPGRWAFASSLLALPIRRRT